ncbi:unnamed protein product [Microthlaspi erraticum]|uniref:Uncharacterized protein n=1 Tax=Microthlaspi erraticum TaxID=1685480 RepID=A0A6D2J4M4_9BRAS|nr:unnamed protein product [Microthlaspi erraticum]
MSPPFTPASSALQLQYRAALYKVETYEKNGAMKDDIASLRDQSGNWTNVSSAFPSRLEETLTYTSRKNQSLPSPERNALVGTWTCMICITSTSTLVAVKRLTTLLTLMFFLNQREYLLSLSCLGKNISLYSEVVNLPGILKEELRKNAADVETVLENCSNRLQWNGYGDHWVKAMEARKAMEMKKSREAKSALLPIHNNKSNNNLNVLH